MHRRAPTTDWHLHLRDGAAQMRRQNPGYGEDSAMTAFA